MHPHAALIQRFYEAFARGDAETMCACYHPEVHFSDPAFPNLHGDRAGAMWRMLCGQAKDLKIEFSAIEADDHTGKAHWDATYTFSATGRKELNRIDASFTFKDGLILRHQDHFDLWKWSRQALGPAGLLLGWTPIVRNKLHAQTAKALDRFLESEAAAS